MLIFDVRCGQVLKHVCYEYNVYAFLASDIDLKMNFTFIIVRHTQKKKILKCMIYKKSNFGAAKSQYLQ